MSRGSPGEYQADEQTGVAGLRFRVSGRGAGRCHAAELSSIRQMSRQVSRGSAVEYHTLGSSQRMVVECKRRVPVSRGLCPDLVAATEKGGSQWPGWCDRGESAR